MRRRLQACHRLLFSEDELRDDSDDSTAVAHAPRCERSHAPGGATAIDENVTALGDYLPCVVRCAHVRGIITGRGAGENQNSSLHFLNAFSFFAALFKRLQPFRTVGDITTVAQVCQKCYTSVGNKA